MSYVNLVFLKKPVHIVVEIFFVNMFVQTLYILLNGTQTYQMCHGEMLHCNSSKNGITICELSMTLRDIN